ncbi:MAG TPA: cell division ATP-binding protein FtsE [Dissulfurispiraceae bacterium]|nr:cell division ATP-binding protein FtsE [Dissulfurispiraceae bacterium]
MIEFKNVAKYYDGQSVLRNISFRIEKGELVFITGHSGAGKTTLLKLIYAAEAPDEGEITIGNFHFPAMKERQIPELRRTIGVVFQDFKLKNDLTVYENVALPLHVRGMAEREVKPLVQEALRRVHLRHKIDVFPKTLSGGEQQRIVIARATVANPVVVLADEPTGNLDEEIARDIMTLFKEIHLQGTTVIIATHFQEMFRRTGRRVIRLDTGSIIGEEVG